MLYLYTSCLISLTLPLVVFQVKKVRKEAEAAKVSSREVLEFERRKIYVVNHQTKKYEIQLQSVAFHSWKDTVQTHKRGLRKLDVFVDTLLKRKTKRAELNFLARNDINAIVSDVNGCVLID